MQALAMDIKIMTVIVIGMLLSIGLIAAFSRRFASDIDTIKAGLNELPLDLNTVIPPMKGKWARFLTALTPCPAR